MGKPQLPGENDILFAYKALSIVPGLSGSARRVAGALIDHFNRQSGRCDPSAERLANMLGMHRVTVLKATKELTKKGVELFVKSSHGGWHNTSSYQPQWQRFRQIVADWKSQMQGDVLQENVAKQLCRREPNGYVDDSQTATQTILNNPSNNRSNDNSAGHSNKDGAHVHSQHDADGKEKRLSKKKRKRELQIPLMRPISGNRSPSHSDVSLMKASERIDKGMLRLGSKPYLELVDALSNPALADCYDQAAIAERDKRGAGMVHILAEVSRCAHG